MKFCCGGGKREKKFKENIIAFPPGNEGLKGIGLQMIYKR